jgi:hypothetical protein
MATSIELLTYLEDRKIRKLPADAFYISNFISAEEEQTILDKVSSLLLLAWLRLLTSNRFKPPQSLAGRFSPIDVYKPGRLTWRKTTSC